jgi:hypothetical protein
MKLVEFQKWHFANQVVHGNAWWSTLIHLEELCKVGCFQWWKMVYNKLNFNAQNFKTTLDAMLLTKTYMLYS